MKTLKQNYMKVSYFEQDILKTLKKKNQNICVKFDELNITNLIETFKYGSKLLCLFFQLENDNMYFENANHGEVDVIPVNTFL